MKKLICVLLAALLALSLFAGCAEKPEPAEGSPAEPTESAAPAEESPSAAPEEPEPEPEETPKAAFIPLTTSTEFFQQMANVFVDKFTAAGYEAEYSSPEFDAAKQMEIIENYVAMGFDLLVVYPVSGEGLSSTVENARSAGVKVIVMVEETSGYDAILRAAGTKIIDAELKMAAEWVEKRFPDAEDGSIKCAAVTYTQTSTMDEYTDAIVKVGEYSPKISLAVTYEVTEDSSAAGQQAAENIYTTDPDIKLIVCVSGTTAYGVNNYYTAISSPVDDLSEIGVFGINGSMESYAAIEASGEDKAVLRGIASIAGIDATISEMVELADKLLAGMLEDPERDGKIDMITAENVGEFLKS